MQARLSDIDVIIDIPPLAGEPGLRMWADTFGYFEPVLECSYQPIAWGQDEVIIWIYAQDEGKRDRVREAYRLIEEAWAEHFKVDLSGQSDEEIQAQIKAHTLSEEQVKYWREINATELRG